MPFLNEADSIFLGEQTVTGIYVGQVRAWPPAQGSQPQISNVSSAGTLTVTWAETEFAELYELRRNGTLISTQSSRVYSDSGLAWNGTYSYTITPIVFGVPGDESVASVTTTIPKGSMGSISASSRTYTNVTVSWAAVPGATHYRVVVNGSAQAWQTSRSRSVSTSEDTTKSIYVQVQRSGVYGNPSRTYSYYSGRKEQRDQGSKSGMVFGPSKVDSWRSVDDWAWLSNIAAQGYYTASYGSYRGVIYYGSSGVRGSLRSKLGGGTKGTNRQSKGSCTKCEVILYKRTGTGTSGTVTIGIARSNSTASGGAPGRTGNVNRTSTTSGNSKWYDIGKAHGQALGDGTHKSLLIRNDGSANYAHFTDCRLRLAWSWNYVTVTAKANTWS